MISMEKGYCIYLNQAMNDSLHLCNRERCSDCVYFFSGNVFTTIEEAAELTGKKEAFIMVLIKKGELKTVSQDIVERYGNRTYTRRVYFIYLSSIKDLLKE